MAKTKTSDIPQEVPMFLRKTYHMIDSCDPAISCWSDDGETFIVKNPSKFEKEIIPQFFKHNKFSSFVRQLNFYSFRKIKYTDIIRLDAKLEAETANFWRFRHENFRRGQPQLLTDIKRMTAAQSKIAATASVHKPAPDAASSSSSSNNNNNAPNLAMKSEIDTLKAQLEEMNKNMSELTTMVQKVSLQAPTVVAVKQEEEEQPLVALSNKRKKIEELLPPDSVSSITMPMPAPLIAKEASVELTDAALDYFFEAGPNDIMFANDENPMQHPSSSSSDSTMEEVPSSNAMDSSDTDMDMDIHISSTVMASASSTRESSTATNMTDCDFVDQLFTVFGDNNSDDKPTPGPPSSTMPAVEDMPAPEPVGSFLETPQTQQHRRVDAELMERLSEALAVLPKEMQEQIVNSLIASIMSNKLVDNTTSSSSSSRSATPVHSTNITSTVPSDVDTDVNTDVPTETPTLDDHPQQQQQQPVIGMPLAAATLASLLSYYSNLVQATKAEQDAKHASSTIVKSLPVIPCHA